ncbi:von Willebrand factor D and EGF domain-containing protein-like [Drosophila albomicans]|uniref:von Willebrand factor D and EGF domain-containing protein-like n=1 Tax=Drosophila albomicans TaxID=7291 RepID=A0A9C6W3S4_DROAB|nr:von Willebrand factor D and EGF domain-containing protein-like [Drosophila albomicans]
MLGYLNLFLIVLFASGLVLAEEYNCIKYANSESDNIPIPVCREECIGRVPDCKPNCYDKCPEHSKCVEPEICKCDKGYVKNGPDTNMTCNPIVCPLNSQIVNDTTCKCFDGYKGDIVEMNAILQSCEPICEPSCPAHSFCASPNKCECDKGYVKNGPDTNMTCNLLVCPSNSQMVNDTTCICRDGYQKVERNAILQSCEPICEPSCPANSFCASPKKFKWLMILLAYVLMATKKSKVFRAANLFANRVAPLIVSAPRQKNVSAFAVMRSMK